MYIYKVRTVVWNSPVHSVCVLDNGVHYLYTDVPLECVNFFSFQIYNRVINFPLQCINSWEFLMYEVSVSHISTNFSCQNKLFYKNLYGFHAEGIYEWRGGDRVPNPRWTTIPNFIWVTPYVLAIAYGEFIFVDLELCPFWHLLWIINCMLYNHISGIMVSLLASSVVDRGFEPWLVKPQTIKLVFVASPLSTQQFRSNS